MARLSIPDEDTKATFTVTTSTSTFPITFSLFAKADLRVSIDGAELTQADFTFTGALLDGGGYNGGDVELNDAVDDVEVVIWRDIAPVRTSNFAPAANAPVGAIDLAFNRLSGIAQDHDRRLSEMDPEIATAAAAVASAQAAIAVANAVLTTADVETTNANVALTAADAAQTAADVDACELLVDDAEAYVAAIPPDVTYSTDAAGRTGVAVDGALYWLRTTDGLQLRSRTNSSTSADVVDGSGNQIIIFSLNGIYTRIQFIPCVASSVTSGNNYSITPEDTRVRYTGSGTQYRWTYDAPAANTVGSGSVDVTIKNGAGTTFITAGIRKRGITTLDGTEFEAGDNITLRRTKASENVGQPLLWLAPPNPALKALSGEIQRAFLQAPSRDKPVLIQKISDRVLSKRSRSVQYDDPALAMESDEEETIFYDMGRAQSLSALTCAMSWAVNSRRALINGQSIRYCDFLSNEGTASVFDREGHSAVEPVFRAGVYTDATSTYDPIGNGHGGIGNSLADVSLVLYDNVSFNGGSVEIEIGDVVTGATSGATGTVYLVTPTGSGTWGAGNKTGYLHMKYRTGAFTIGENLQVGGVTHALAVTTGVQANTFPTMATGAAYNCAESVLTQRFDTYYDQTDVTTWYGEMTYIHRTNVDGTHFDPTVARGGRRMAFDAGSSEITAGASINGATSGATADVVYVSATGFTGSWGGGTAAGTMFLKNVVGVFQDNETIRVGVTTKAVVNGTLGAAVGIANAYGPLMVSKVPNKAKINGFPVIEIGNADGSQRPSNIAPYADGNDPNTGVAYAGTWTVSEAPEGPSPLQFWHTRNAVAGETVIMEMVFDGAPMTPPGAYSWCDNSQVQCEDRAGGTRKFSVNTTSGIARLFEGTFTVPRFTHRHRVGDPV